MTTVCRCPDMKFDVNGSVVPLPPGMDPTCPSCYPDARAALAQQCSAERPFGPCTKRCDQPAGHGGPHRAQCFAWCDPHDISTDIANLWSGPKDLYNPAHGGQIIGQMVTRYCRNCPWREEHMCAFGEDGDCDHTEGWTEK